MGARSWSAAAAAGPRQPGGGCWRPVRSSLRRPRSLPAPLALPSPPAAELLEALRAAADALVKGDPKEFSGVLSVNLKEGGQPLKVMISVYW